MERMDVASGESEFRRAEQRSGLKGSRLLQDFLGFVARNNGAVP